MRWIVPLVYLVLAAATATAAMIAISEAVPRVTAVAADGDFELSNTRAGSAVFTARGIGPGESASGTVEIAAGGGEAVQLTLSQDDLLDTPGPAGGLLSTRLALRVRELTGSRATVYSGPLAAMPPQPLGRLEPGAPRSFEFVATLPEAGPAVDQNAVQGAATSVAYAWTVSEADALDLVVIRVRQRIRAGRLLVWANCDHPCAIVARGRLRAHDEDDRRNARLRFARRTSFTAGPQRLRIRLPRHLRRWLAADPSRERARARVRFVAWDAGGDRDLVRRTLRLRSAR